MLIQHNYNKKNMVLFAPVCAYTPLYASVCACTPQYALVRPCLRLSALFSHTRSQFALQTRARVSRSQFALQIQARVSRLQFALQTRARVNFRRRQSSSRQVFTSM